MTFSGHIAATTFVLAITQQPLVVVILCFVLHLAVDAIPHVEWQDLSKASTAAKCLMTLDSLLTFTLTASLYATFSAQFWLVSAALLAGLFPDLTNELTKRFLPRFWRFHERMHTWPEPIISPIAWGKTISGRTPNTIKVGIQVLLVLSAQLYLILSILQK